jgi:hypothetical protein
MKLLSQELCEDFIQGELFTYNSKGEIKLNVPKVEL